ncbi:hypothetical protein GIB67_039975 [Kingdonia uniflora]|uniref:Uncharacterized protein n=1 Tax=Kingdonia uniflora TaxID=39325 RepID=A0A7J7P4F7_9MAGN|nr:hypothetical protein GIB67_039975 [Kingdonia uniflora]
MFVKVQADVISVLVEKLDVISLALFSCLLPVAVGLLYSKVDRSEYCKQCSIQLQKIKQVLPSVIRNPYDEEDVNPFANPGSVPPATNSRLSPLPPEPAGFNYDRDATIDILLDLAKDLKKKEKELHAKESDLKKREQFMMESQLKMTSYSILAIVHR